MATRGLIGKQLGDYKILDVLGHGGMADVYKGYDENLDRYAAVKVIEPKIVPIDNEEEYRERFSREARSIARLHHPRIVGVYQFGKIENLYYMAMVFIEGRDLRQVMQELGRRKKRLSHPQLLRIMRDTAEALDYAHSQGVIHRDIKPSNIMVKPDGHAVLTDFGLALSTAEGTIGNTFGSVHYIAPEQAVSSAQASPQSDLYSLGVILYEIMTGRVPFDDASAMSVALKHISEPPSPPREINPEVPEAVDRVIVRALDKEPENRYESGATFIHALEAAFASSDDEDTHNLDSQKFSPIDSSTATSSIEDPTVKPVRSVTDPQKPTREVSAPDDADAVAILGTATPATNPGDRPIAPETQTNLKSPAKTDPSTSKRDTPLSPLTEEEAKAVDKKRRSSGLIVAGVVILVLIAVIVVLVLMSSGNEDDGLSVAGGDNPTETVEPTADATGTAQALALAAAEEATETPTEEPTEEIEPTEEATQEPTEEIEPSEEATQEPTEEPTDDPTEEPTDEPTEEATDEPSEEPTDEPATTSTELPVAAPTVAIDATDEDPAEILLRYDGRTLVVYNRLQQRTVNVRSLEFIRETDTREIMYEAREWIGSGDALPPSSCFQVWSTSFVNLPRNEFPAEICRSRRGFAQTNRTFWISNGTETIFEVRSNGALLGTCPTVSSSNRDDNRCVIEMP